jgi:hypothetical protein
MEKKEGTLDNEEMEMTEKGMKEKVIFLLKRILHKFFLGGFVIYIGVNPYWESDTALLYGGALRFSSSLLLSESFSRGEFEPGPGRHANQCAMSNPNELRHFPMWYATPE